MLRSTRFGRERLHELARVCVCVCVFVRARVHACGLPELHRAIVQVASAGPSTPAGAASCAAEQQRIAALAAANDLLNATVAAQAAEIAELRSRLLSRCASNGAPASTAIAAAAAAAARGAIARAAHATRTGAALGVEHAVSYRKLLQTPNGHPAALCPPVWLL